MGMMIARNDRAKSLVLGVTLNLLLTTCFAATQAYETYNEDSLLNSWKPLLSGLDLLEINAYTKPYVEDGKLTIIRIQPALFNFRLISTPETKLTKPGQYWVEALGLNMLFNAGMYNLKDGRSHRYFMKNYKHLNNSNLSVTTNGIIAFNRKNESVPTFGLYDLTKSDWEMIDTSYNTIIQGLRMIDGDGCPVYWNDRVQSCSMIIIAQDRESNIYVIFSKTPFTQNQMIDNLLNLPIALINAVYLEGGSRSNLIVSTTKFKMKRVGSFGSDINSYNKNSTFFPFPNFIGLTLIP
jgi:hypothetical protein